MSFIRFNVLKLIFRLNVLHVCLSFIVVDMFETLKLRVSYEGLKLKTLVLSKKFKLILYDIE